MAQFLCRIPDAVIGARGCKVIGLPPVSGFFIGDDAFINRAGCVNATCVWKGIFEQQHPSGFEKYMRPFGL